MTITELLGPIPIMCPVCDRTMTIAISAANNYSDPCTHRYCNNLGCHRVCVTQTLLCAQMNRVYYVLLREATEHFKFYDNLQRYEYVLLKRSFENALRISRNEYTRVNEFENKLDWIHEGF